MPTPLPHPICEYLGSKKLYMMTEDRDLYLEDLYSAGENNLWCRHTQTDTGPDGGWVIFEKCAPGRGCYVTAEQSRGVGFRNRQ
jgi:hypothetical protein